MSDQLKHNHSIYNYVANFQKAMKHWVCVPLAVALITAFSASLVTAAELVVISSTSKDFKVGQIVNSSDVIDLTGDAMLTLISENGKVIILKGPHSGPPSVEEATDKKVSLIPSLKKLITGEKTESKSLGVVRSIGGAALPQDPWAIIAGKAGKYCITLSKPVTLWRSNSLKTSKLVLLNTTTKKEVKTVWHAGQNTLFWPRLQPLIDGATYRVDLPGETSLPKITLAIVPKFPTTAHAAVWMAENGCAKQAARLIESMK